MESSVVVDGSPATRTVGPRPRLQSIVLEGRLHARVASDAVHYAKDAGRGSISDLPSSVCCLETWHGFLAEMTGGRTREAERIVLKSSPDVEVEQTAIGDGSRRRSVVVKRYCEARRRGWRRWFSRSLADGDFRCLERLRSSGVAVPRPLAFVGSRGSGSYSWLVTEFVEGLVDLEQIVLVSLPQFPLERVRACKAGIAAAVVRLLGALDRGGLHHRDLKASNILIRHWDRADGVPEAWIVDVEGVREGKAFSESKREQRLMRLGASLHEYSSITRTDRARFLRDYGRQLGWASHRWRVYFRRLSRRADVYLRRSTSRKRHKIDGYVG